MAVDEIKKTGLPRGIGWGIFALILVFIGGLFLTFGRTKDITAERVAGNIDELKSGVEDLRNFNTESAKERFSRIGTEIVDIRDSVGIFGSLFSGTGELLLNFQNVTAQGIALSGEMEFLRANALGLFLEDGKTLLEHLKTVQGALRSVDESARKLATAASGLNEAASLAGEFYLPFQLDLARFMGFLDALLPKLEAEEINFLVLFQNPSEIRPAGGFLGSYAVVSVKGGQLQNVEVHDVNDVDRTFEDKITPPRPLQAVARSWRPYDANWFFDFALSAKKVAKFFETSGLYRDKAAPDGAAAPFDGVMAVSPKVVEDILALTGPIELPERKLVFNEDNFLMETQRLVQEGQATNSTYPKKILEELAPLIFERVKTMDDAQKNEFWNLVSDWISRKDIMVYFVEPKLQSFARYYGATGETYELSQDWNGNYLALVDANIGGGKSDLFIKQNIVLESQINADGTISNHLVVDRIHEGNRSKYWWYKETNQNYLQVFVPSSARLTNFKGGVDKTITPKVNYVKEGYDVDSDVSAIESSEEAVFNFPAVRMHKELGKSVFSTWSATKAGARTQLVFDYVTRLALAPEDGVEYHFVFEKQAGTARNYKFQISAPAGFRFAESGLPVFAYEAVSNATSSSALPGRLIVDLTLERI
ncbi:MAG: DUF4012 domain-containing protein [Patescibacteria group bacterium]